jgi:small nuclear ribonucleoprotein (snRNP)-like protein
MLDFWQRLAGLFRPYPVLKAVIVNLKGGRSFRGVVFKQPGEYLVLKNAEMLDKSGATSLDGEVLLRRADIEFMQVPK